MDVDGLLISLTVLVSISFLAAIYFSVKLSRETKYERYWLAIALAAFLLAIHHWLALPWEFHLISESILHNLEQFTALFGASLFAYAVYGLYSSMKRIREKLE